MRVAVGLSGGVDSAVSAWLLKNQGYDVTGVYMQCWDSKLDGCTSDEDKSYAVQTAAKLDIPFISLDFIKQYKKQVIDYFYSEYKAGRTPNPDVMCNKEIKFGLFYDWIVENGFDYMATGHYARVQKTDKASVLMKGLDPSKDQSYFLYRVGQEQLSKTIFPVGNMLKKDVRKLAENEQLPPYKRAESMGICFVGEVDIKKFLEARLEHRVGSVVDIDGNVIGSHDGAWFYTIGQRHGYTLNKYFGVATYVLAKDVEKNILVVGVKDMAYTHTFNVTDLSLNKEVLNSHLPKGADRLVCDVRIRHLGQLYSATVIFSSLNSGVGIANILIDEPIFAVASGQSAVFYVGDLVLGGGIIL